MGEDSQEKEQIRVVDRRRFTNDGDSVQEEAAGSQQTQPASEGSLGQTRSEGSSRTTTPPKAHEEQNIDFTSFIVSLATQCLMMLGEMPNPETKAQSVNIGAAKQTIEILALLEAKTKGNLTPDENKMLGEILSALRLAFAKKVSK